jgi:hypothetical protein
LQSISKFSHSRIQQEIRDSEQIVDNVLKSLTGDTAKPTTDMELRKLVLKDLTDMGFLVKHDRRLCNIFGNQSISGFTLVRTSNRLNGGIILLNPDCSVQEQFETLIHEYIHIKDISLPVYVVHANDTRVQIVDNILEYINSPEQRDMIDRFIQNLVEIKADMRTYMLLMPQNEMRECLRKNSYDIKVILKEYDFMEKSSVLQWISIIDKFSCHFVKIWLTKDNNNEITGKIIRDSYHYSKRSDPEQFDIKTVLDTSDSAASVAMRDRINIEKDTLIGDKEYHCYTYYEIDQVRILRSSVISGDIVNKHDTLLIIGWEKDIYDAIQYISNP